MINIKLTKCKDNESYQKNVLYQITGADMVCFMENHGDTKEIVQLDYHLEEDEYGIYANEYKRHGLLKDNCKTADVLTCVINESTKKIFTFIFDVKSNISSFSDDLTKDNAVLVAIKEVRDFIEQIRSEILHKNSFMIYYHAGGYHETEQIGLVTKNFEANKFAEAAELLEKVFDEDDESILPLIRFKFKTNLKPYLSEGEQLRRFAEKKVLIGEKIYDLNVYLLNKRNDAEYDLTLNIHNGIVTT